MAEGVNKKDLINLISDKMKQLEPDVKMTKKSIETVLEATIKAMTETLQQGKKIAFIGFGSFVVKQRKATVKTNPKHKEKKIQVPAKNIVKFKPSDKLNDSLN